MTRSRPFYIESLGELYVAVQESGIFSDSKYFPDCLPKQSPARILAAFKQLKKAGRINLRAFVEDHFDPPPAAGTEYHSGEKPIGEHLHGLWEVLTRQPGETRRSTLLPLPHPYVVPGGRFREIYYWDSYFTMLGLAVSGRFDLIGNMLDNFAHLIRQYGFIPNGNRSYYLGRSQPPFFSLMVGVLAGSKGSAIWEKYLPEMELEYRFWMKGASKTRQGTSSFARVVRLPGMTPLNRFYDQFAAPRPEAYAEDVHIAGQSGRPAHEVYRHIRAAAESGWDFSSRWFADPARMETIETTNILPVDLNCLLWNLENSLAAVYAAAGNAAKARKYDRLCMARADAVRKLFWDEREGFFFDYDFTRSRLTGRPTLAAVYPLFFGLAEPVQAARVAEYLEKHFLSAGGLRSTLQRTGQQWDDPNGWAPLHWMAYRGLQQYGFEALAEKVRLRWMAMCEKTYSKTGKMMEKYNVVDADLPAGGGEYPNQDGFGWTNGVYLKLAVGF